MKFYFRFSFKIEVFDRLAIQNPDTFFGEILPSTKEWKPSTTVEAVNHSNGA